ncbi:MAG: ribose 5-phosphate isomerase B [Clostridiaceae bacterium]|nr:ribose 5-phosphate isomerase B [Clostridiaceae bacterium]
MRIALGSDHGGFRLKEFLKQHLENQGHECTDCGTYDESSVDYPDFALKACLLVREGTCDRAVLVCSTGIGISIAANKVRGVRCALCHDLLSAHLTRDHNDTNVLAMGSFIVGEKLAAAIVDEWLKTPFSNQGRHSKRISKIHEIEDRYLK